MTTTGQMIGYAACGAVLLYSLGSLLVGWLRRTVRDGR